MILIGDMLVYCILVEWCRLGLWINLLGFSVYHSRGDVWLPTPPAAVNFLMGMVLPATMLFATLFLLISCLIFLFARFSETDKAGGRHLLYDAFYGDGRKLLVKYLVFFLSSAIVPLAIRLMWRIRSERLFSIEAGFGITLAAFIVIVLAADILLARPTLRQAPARV